MREFYIECIRDSAGRYWHDNHKIVFFSLFIVSPRVTSSSSFSPTMMRKLPAFPSLRHFASGGSLYSDVKTEYLRAGAAPKFFGKNGGWQSAQETQSKSNKFKRGKSNRLMPTLKMRRIWRWAKDKVRESPSRLSRYSTKSGFFTFVRKMIHKLWKTLV